MSFGEKLAAARRRANITQENLARILGVSRQAVSKWESDLTLPESEKLPRIAQLLQVSLDELMELKAATPTDQKAPCEEGAAPTTVTLPLRLHFEYKSRRTVRGIPLVHINFGFGKRARGLVAIGNHATGVLALGLLAKGVFPFGLLALGLMPYGVLAVGLAAFGSLAFGLFAAGAIACGLFAVGAIAIGCYATGALAIGVYGALGDHAISSLGVAWGKTYAQGADAIFPKSLFSAQRAEALAHQIKEAAPALLRPLAALFALLLGAAV